MSHDSVERNELENLFYTTALKILNALNESFGEIGKERKQYINTLLTKTKVCSGEEDATIISSYIEAVPMLYADGVFLHNISIYMPKPDGTNLYISKLYHEISHIIANAPITLLAKNKYLYNWGICSTIYTVSENKISEEPYHEHRRLNEFLNDLCAEYFYRLIEGKKYRSLTFKNPLLKLCKHKKIEEMYDVIVAYIMNDYWTIEQILCKISGKDIKSLREYLGTI